jgi:hypothetical protein
MEYKIFKQAQNWKYALGVLPISALAIIVLVDLIGWNIHIYVTLSFLLIFFIIGVIWWIWAIDKIVFLAKMLITAESKMYNINKELKEIKKRNRIS